MRKILIFFLFITNYAFAKPNPYSYADTVQLTEASVVSIQTSKKLPKNIHPLLQDPQFDQLFRFFFGQPLNPQQPQQPQGQEEEVPYSLGSGVIIDQRGYVLTNHHVIKDSSSIFIKLYNSEEKISAEVIGSDPNTDLAVLKINHKNLSAIKIGDSSKLRVGDVVLAIGNPFGIGQAVSLGIISATARDVSKTGFDDLLLDTFLQTDAAINPGNSGGALIDAHGNLIGINTAILSPSGGNNGIGFAIPINAAKVIMDQLIKDGHITRGWLGVQLQEITPTIKNIHQFKDNYGVYVQAVVRGSPAQLSGILPGDILLTINGTKIKDMNHARKIVAGLKPKANYSLEVFRRGEYLSFAVLIAERTE